jgi:hypothetical protein
MPLLGLSAKTVVKNVSALGDGLVIDRDCAAGSDPPAVPTKISPEGCTKAPGLLAGDKTLSTTDVTCGEFTAPGAENWIFP